MAESPNLDGASVANVRPSCEQKSTKEKSTLQKNRSQTSGVQDNRLLCEISQTGIPIAAMSQICNDEEAGLPVSSRYVIAEESGRSGNQLGHAHLLKSVSMEASEMSANFIQRQLLQNQQFMLQQQHAVKELTDKVEALTKSVTPVTSVNKTPEVSEHKVVRRKTQKIPPKKGLNKSIYDEIDSSEHDYSSEEEHTLSTSEEENDDVVMLDSDEGLAESAAKRQKVDPDISAPEVEGENMQLLRQLGKEFDHEEQYGEKVHSTLSAVVNSGIKAPVDRKLAKQLCEKQLRPENCEFLRVPRVNKELWVHSNLQKKTKENDRKYQVTQLYLSRGLVPLVKLMDLLLKTDKSEEFKLARDSFQLLAYAHRDLTNLRRQCIKPAINEKYQLLCHDSTPLTENLLGDELDKQLKSLDEAHKLTKNISRKSFSNYPRSQSKYSGSKRDHRGYQKTSGYGYQGYQGNNSYGGHHFLSKKNRRHQNQSSDQKSKKQYQKDQQ